MNCVTSDFNACRLAPNSDSKPEISFALILKYSLTRIMFSAQNLQENNLQILGLGQKNNIKEKNKFVKMTSTMVLPLESVVLVFFPLVITQWLFSVLFPSKLHQVSLTLLLCSKMLNFQSLLIYLLTHSKNKQDISKYNGLQVFGCSALVSS